jgi:hypothetical protein
MTPKTLEPTNSQILEAVHSLSGSVDKRFATTDSRADEILEAIQMYSTSADVQLRDIRGQIGDIRGQLTNFVTKDYLDDRLSDLRGDLVVLTRKEDTKLHALVDILHDKRAIDDNDVRRVERLEPFAR